MLDAGLASFDGIDDCLILPNDPALASDTGTAAMWIWRHDDVDAYYYSLISKAVGDGQANSWEIYIQPNDLLVPILYAQITAMPVAMVTFALPTVLEWVHVAATWDGSMLELWVDGLSVGQVVSPPVPYDDHAVQVACDDNGVELAGHLGGFVDDVRVYTRVLEPAEIATLAQSVPARPAG
jgi:hypothetical protein